MTFLSIVLRVIGLGLLFYVMVLLFQAGQSGLALMIAVGALLMVIGTGLALDTFKPTTRRRR